MANEPEIVAEYEPAVDHDGWYSFLISFSFHLVMILTFWLLSMVIVQHDTSAPPIQIVQVGESTSAAGPVSDSMPAGDSPDATSDAPAALNPIPDLPTTSVQDATAIDTKVDLETSNQAVRQSVSQQLDDARRAVAAAKAAVAGKMRENMGSGSPGGGTGGGGGRAGRAARWVLQFNTASPKDYLAQLGGLEAEVAFPQRGDKYLYFSNLSGTPKSNTRDLSGETRIYWMDENPSSYQPVARDLGVGAASLMVAFLPESLEEKMLKMELAYRGAKSEDEIAQTVFKCLRRGDGYDVIIVKQLMRGE